MKERLTLAEVRVLTALLTERQTASIEALQLGSWALIDSDGWMVGTFKTMARATEHISEHLQENSRMSLDKISQGHYWVEEFLSRKGKQRVVLNTYEITQINLDTFVEIKSIAIRSILPIAFDMNHPLWELRKNLRCGKISENEALDAARDLLRVPQQEKKQTHAPTHAIPKGLRVTTAQTARSFLDTITAPTFIPVEEGLFLCIDPGKYPYFTEYPDTTAARIPLPFFAKDTASVVYKYRRYINKYIGRMTRGT